MAKKVTLSDLERLKDPVPGQFVNWRVQKTIKGDTVALVVPYIDARAVMDRLDEVVGPTNWSDRYEETAKGFVGTLRIRVDGEWVEKSDGADLSNFEATKGGVSDAFKRAGVKWGIGRYLYDLNAQWVKCEKKGKSVKLKETPTLPAWDLG